MSEFVRVGGQRAKTVAQVAENIVSTGYLEDVLEHGDLTLRARAKIPIPPVQGAEEAAVRSLVERMLADIGALPPGYHVNLYGFFTEDTEHTPGYLPESFAGDIVDSSGHRLIHFTGEALVENYMKGQNIGLLIRLVRVHIPLDDFVNYLKSIGYAGDYEDLKGVLSRTPRWVSEEEWRKSIEEIIRGLEGLEGKSSG